MHDHLYSNIRGTYSAAHWALDAKIAIIQMSLTISSLCRRTKVKKKEPQRFFLRLYSLEYYSICGHELGILISGVAPVTTIYHIQNTNADTVENAQSWSTRHVHKATVYTAMQLFNTLTISHHRLQPPLLLNAERDKQ